MLPGPRPTSIPSGVYNTWLRANSTRILHSNTLPVYVLKNWEYGGGGHWLVWIEWCPAVWSLCLPPLIFPWTCCKSRFIFVTDSLVTPVSYTSCRRDQRSSRQLVEPTGLTKLSVTNRRARDWLWHCVCEYSTLVDCQSCV